jgi:uncharacterized protein (TIGR02246 family)
MKLMLFRNFYLALVALSLGSTMTFAQVAQEDERAIRALVQEFDTAWNARDAAQFSACFTEGGEMWFRPTDKSMRGRDQIRKAYTQLLSGLTLDMKHVTVIQAINPVARGVMFLDGNVDILASAPGGSGTVISRRYSGVAILKKTVQGWRILFLRAWTVPVTSANEASTPHTVRPIG